MVLYYKILWNWMLRIVSDLAFQVQILSVITLSFCHVRHSEWNIIFLRHWLDPIRFHLTGSPHPTHPFSFSAWPDPIRPDPIRPDSTRPDPTRPDPTQPDPTRLDSTRPGLIRSDPTRPNPTVPSRPDPTRPDPTRPDPTWPDPAQLDPIRPIFMNMKIYR